MKEQVLDSMELERERGITIKMQPVRMKYSLDGEEYILNLIDTPGHIDFAYEVSRAIKAVEGTLLLVDATQGVQAQTLSVLAMAKEADLTIIPVLSKVDSPIANVEEVKDEIVKLLNCKREEIIETSGKTGEGVELLLKTIIEQIPAPKSEFGEDASMRALVFDFQYSNHQGIVLYCRMFDGEVGRADYLKLLAANEKFQTMEVGVFAPEQKATDKISAGEIGYIVTGIKRPGIASVGDTVSDLKAPLPALHGYLNPRPVVWASVYPESQDDFDGLRQALDRLRLSDSSLTFEEENSGTLGRGFRCGFLGMLHLEIISERLKREFNLSLIVTTPSIIYDVVLRGGKKERIYTPSLFPEYGLVQSVEEPWVHLIIITPQKYIGDIIQLSYYHEAELGDTENFGEDRARVNMMMPLRELMRNFFDELKSVSSGFASLSYETIGMRPADVVKLELLVAEEPVPAFARVVSRMRVEEEAEKAVEKLHSILPKQLFTTKIQGRALGRIISSRTIAALKKNVTINLYGGDITRKRKLWEKQKKGKERLKERGRVNIPQEVFLKMMRGGNNN
jgi:GTP-binding protein LepA